MVVDDDNDYYNNNNIIISTAIILNVLITFERLFELMLYVGGVVKITNLLEYS